MFKVQEVWSVGIEKTCSISEEFCTEVLSRAEVWKEDPGTVRNGQKGARLDVGGQLPGQCDDPCVHRN